MLNCRVTRNIRTFSAINVALSIILFLSLLMLIRDILSPGFRLSSDRGRSKPNVTAGTQDQYKALKDLEPLVKNNPFGFSGGEFGPIDSPEVPRSSDITLIGTLSGSSHYAIFVNKDGKQEIFKKGERVFQSGELEKVFKNKVIIREGGRLREVPHLDISNIETTEIREPAKPSLVRSSGNNNFIVSKEGILHAIDNPAQLMTDARLQPNYVNGRQEGFVLREVKKGGIYESLGLQNEDVLVRINDYNIKNPEIALQALTALKGMDRVELDIIRNGKKMTLTYQIR